MVGVKNVVPTRTLPGVAGEVPVPPVPAAYVIHAPCPVTTGIPFHKLGGLIRANPMAPAVMYAVGGVTEVKAKLVFGKLLTVGAFPKKLTQRKESTLTKAVDERFAKFAGKVMHVIGEY